MASSPSSERMRRKRERDRAAGLVRIDERVPTSCVEELKSIAADMRRRTFNQTESTGDDPDA